MKHILTIAIIFSLAFVSFSCGDKEKDIAVTGLTLNANYDDDGNIVPFRVGSRATLELFTTVTPIFATNQMITWSSSNPSVATVNDYGLVTAHAENVGTTTITARIVGNDKFVVTREVVVFFVPLPPTVETIVDYEVYPPLESLRGFLNNGVGTYNITLMSPRLETWRAAYKAAVPEFDRFTIVMPWTAEGQTGRQLGVQMHYTNTSGVWPYRATTEATPPVTPMTGDGNNPNSDGTFDLQRVDRTSSNVPHSTTPPTFTVNAGNPHNQSAVVAAITNIFTPIGTASSAERNTPAIDNNNFIGLLSAPTGWTIIQDDRTFWFRSKADPNDWFVAVRQ